MKINPKGEIWWALLGAAVLFGIILAICFLSDYLSESKMYYFNA